MPLAQPKYLVLYKFHERKQVFGYDDRGEAVERCIELEASVRCEVQLKNTRTGCVEYRSRFRFGA